MRVNDGKDMKRLITIVCLFLFSVASFAWDEQLWQTILQDPTRAGVVLHGYEFQPFQPIDVPDGYTPFYISHYGRHGSRSDFGDGLYREVVTCLSHEAERKNLTPAGEELLSIAQRIVIAHDSCAGRLTDKGEREHSMLAQRMYQRAPEVFTTGSHTIRAISSTIPRSIISMTAFTNTLTSISPNLRYNFDTGERTQQYIACAGKPDTKDIYAKRDELMTNHQPDEAGTQRKLTLSAFDFDSTMTMAELEKAIYYTTVIAEDFDIVCNPLRYLSEKSLYRQMMELTYNMTLPFIRIPGFYERRAQTVQKGIDDFVNKADEAIECGDYCADLRFGHDVPLLCMAARMGISGVGSEMTAEQVESQWYGWSNVPMASNLQMIFYKPAHVSCADVYEHEILVLILYNEQPRTLIHTPPTHGEYFYSWDVLKNVLKNKE